MVCTVLILVMWTSVVTVDGAVNSSQYKSLGCHSYAAPGGQLERCQGLYTLERSWNDAAAWCNKDGWTGLALANTSDVEAVLGDFVVWMSDELDADNGYRAWIGGQEVDDRVWKWSDGTAFQRRSSDIHSSRVPPYNRPIVNCIVCVSVRPTVPRLPLT